MKKHDDGAGYAIREGITWRQVNDEAVILDLETSEYFSANEAGSRIWELLSSGTPVSGIAGTISAEYGIPTEDAAGDTEDFIKDLLERKLIRKGGPSI